MIYPALGETDAAFEWLRAAYRERFSLLVLLELDPRFDNLRTDPRFTSLLGRIADNDTRL
jgi:adenylate cyclase